jgi:Na+/pantothenate symporter
VDEIMATQTEPGDFPNIVIGELDAKNKTIPVQLVVNNEPHIYAGIMFAQQLFQIAANMATETHQDSQMILNDLLAAEAHIAIG